MAIALGSAAKKLRLGSSAPSRIYAGSTAFWDADAAAYVAAVEAADTQPLELGVVAAYHNFVLGCKADGIWDAIKASCILAGARTLAGALVPLKGTAPTNNNFVGGDYNREAGLVGDGSTKYLDSNRANNADGQSDHHVASYATSTQAGGNIAFAGASDGTYATILYRTSANNWLLYDGRLSAPSSGVANASLVGLVGLTRSGASAFSGRVAGVPVEKTEPSFSWGPLNHFVFGYNASGLLIATTSSRLAFYSIGESLDLALLDTRVSALVTAIGAAI